MDVTPIGSRAVTSRIVQHGQAPREDVRKQGIAELLLGVVMEATCGAASPVMMTLHAGEPLRVGRFDLDARLAHADARQQRWLAELRQAGILVGRAHVVLEAELPSSSYVPWRSGMGPVVTSSDDGMAQCLRVAQLCDRDSQSRTDGEALMPLWSTIRYLGDIGQPAREQASLTVSPMCECRFGALAQYEFEVFEAEARVATITAVYEREHA